METLYEMNTKLVNDIKQVIINMVNNFDENLEGKYSVYLSKKLGYNYTYMANAFSAVTGGTIQGFIITTKIEKAKELLLAKNTLTEISDKLYYSSVSHLSSAFKKIIGLNPSEYLKLNNKQSVYE